MGRSLRNKPKPKLTEAEIMARQFFVQEARSQLVCAACGVGNYTTVETKGGLKKVTVNWDAHHVIERSFLKREGLVQFDSRNALRLCAEPGVSNCHGAHTNRSKPLELTMLLDINIEYAVYLLGPDRADLQLRRWYVGEDPRLEAAVAAGTASG